MASNTRAFFVGVGTTFAVLAVGFGGGIMLAKGAMEPSPSAAVRSTPILSPVRIILPASADAAQPPQAPASPAPVPALQGNRIQEAHRSPEQNDRAGGTEHRIEDSRQRERRNRVVERRAKRETARVAKQQQLLRQGIVAFGGENEQPTFGTNFSGN